MSKEDLELDDDFIDEDGEEINEVDPATTSKNSLTKRRVIDNLLDERRLSKELADYDYDLD
ncbi:PA3496 family putative envelope integrity protein [Thiopseudomonas denitrificans]|uniref:Leucyl-tRNA synthetase n=1 Tax=Thiopseudomonas denitrificans TaxID=1501432 RepID=A0A4R6TWZ2_9GAMM|nr:hypothetical protein [Thiopseudomonas denitrificans]TDQ36803.1 hypothetical protein DFQ45_11015 [Thiopseudomonas denitrificans]